MNVPASSQTPSITIVPTIEALLRTRGEDIRAWFAKVRTRVNAPFYSSVDVRHAGYKLAPVDTNIFPAGFNHLSQAARARAKERIQARISAQEIKNILIIPENHTRNQGYIDNLYALSTLVAEAGAEVRIGSLIAEKNAPIALSTSSGAPVNELPLLRDKNTLSTEDGFVPELILLNNDLTSGLPEVLRGLTQRIQPRPSLGWYRRRKSIHFDAYDKLAQEFAQAFDLDPWLITTETHKCGLVNFGDRKGLDCVAVAVEKVLHKIRVHYRHYGITSEPYVFVKSDAGTYGMGIMTAKSGDEVVEMNKKVRNKMNTIKEGTQSTEVIIQEGVPTIDTVEGFAAEPMMYLVDGYAVGGAYRVNRERDAEGNLNASGMYFAGMCDEGEVADAAHVNVAKCSFGAFGLIASLASLAVPSEEYGEQYSI
ncbi:MAG: glutamate--cysteine ligase [Alphaproteobacteria bacterium]|nr:glutamate--cysteine ligase [Alphaproteobacteria bacterium]